MNPRAGTLKTGEVGRHMPRPRALDRRTASFNDLKKRSSKNMVKDRASACLAKQLSGFGFIATKLGGLSNTDT